MGKNRKQPRKRQTAYRGPLHQEQYMPQLQKMFRSGAFKPGQVYDVEIVHDEEDDGNVVGINVNEMPQE